MLFDSQDPSFFNTVFIITCIPTVLSFFACLWTCYSCYKIWVDNNASLKFVVAIILFDLGLAITTLFEVFHEFNSDFICKTEAILRPIFYAGNFFLAMLMGFLCYRAITNSEGFDQNKFFYKSLVGTFLVSAWLFYAFTFSGIYHIERAKFNIKCFLKQNNGLSPLVSLAANLFLSNTLLISVGLIVLLFICVKIFRIVRQFQLSIYDKTGAKMTKLLYFPAIQILIALPGIIFTVTGRSENSVWLKTLFGMAQHSVGLVNAIIFGVQMQSYNERRNNQSSQFYMRMASESIKSTESEL